MLKRIVLRCCYIFFFSFMSAVYPMNVQLAPQHIKDNKSLARMAARVLVRENKIPKVGKAPKECIDMCNLERALQDCHNDADFVYLREVYENLNDINTNDMNWVLFHQIITKNDKELVKVLVHAGADVNYSLQGGPALLHGMSPLCLAIAKCFEKPIMEVVASVEVVQALVDMGVDVNFRIAQEIGSVSLLMFAYHARRGDNTDFHKNRINDFNHIQLLSLLLQAGAQYVKRDFLEDVLLHFAIAKRDINQVIALLEEGVGVNALDNFTRTPLHWAAAVGDNKIVLLLLQNGAEINIENSWGQTALHIAVEGGHAKVIQELLKAGAQINMNDEEIISSLNFALDNGHKEAMRVLFLNLA